MKRSEDSVEARLRFALSAELGEMHEGVDMSASAVSQRLRDAAEMSSLCLQLMDAKLRSSASP